MRTPRFWYEEPGLPAALLAPLGAAYGGVGRLRRRLVRPVDAGVPVICVGNLVAGGAGKTPVALALARRCAAAGAAPHFLTRGYGGRLAGPLRVDPARHDAAAVGDEPLLLAAVAPTWVARDRVAGARAAVAAGAGLLVMDDGFQNPHLRKDLAVLVVDGETGFGNGRMIPAGPLREPPDAGLARADAVVVLGEDKGGLGALLADGGRPVLHARLEPDAAAAARLRGVPVVAFAGIARPEKFFDTLERVGARIIVRFAYPDHHRFDPDEIMQMAELASAAEANLITTAKDHARLPAEARPMTGVLPVRVAWRDEAALARLLAPLLGPPAAGGLHAVP